MSVIFICSLSLANIESATSDVQKSRLKMVERRPPIWGFGRLPRASVSYFNQLINRATVSGAANPRERGRPTFSR